MPQNAKSWIGDKHSWSLQLNSLLNFLLHFLFIVSMCMNLHALFAKLLRIQNKKILWLIIFLLKHFERNQFFHSDDSQWLHLGYTVIVHTLWMIYTHAYKILCALEYLLFIQTNKTCTTKQIQKTLSVQLSNTMNLFMVAACRVLRSFDVPIKCTMRSTKIYRRSYQKNQRIQQ